ncbi:uncharacterized protein LOC141610871 isoform X2 [Silene latifolia]|uniref:uncharacterized protein LOC141610871 isoform X2 n=1 Tax=Silene latifolia TaxID=37657 RepID=UPI003D76BE07
MRITKRQLELESTPSKNFTQKIYRPNDTTFDYLGHGSIHTTTVYLLHPPPQPPNPTTSNHHDDDRRPWIVAAIEDTLKLQLRHPLTLKPHPSTLPKTNFSYSTVAVSYHASYFFDKLIVTEDHALFALYNGGVLRARPGNGTESTDWITLNHGDGGDTEDKFDDVVVFKGKVYALDRDGLLYLINNYVNSQQITMGKMVIKRAVGSEFKWRKRVVIDGEKRMYMVVRTGEKGLVVYKQITRGKAVYWEKIQAFDGNKVLFMSRDYCFFMRASVIDVKKYKNCIVFSQWAFPRYGYSGWEFSSFNWSWEFAEKEIAVFRLRDQSFSAGSKINWSAPYWTKQQSSGLNVASFRAYAARCRISGVQVDQVEQVDQSQSSSDSEIESERNPDEDEGLDSDSQYEEGEVQSDSKDSDSKDDEQEETGSDSDSQDKDQEGVESDSGSQDQDQEGVESDSNSQDQEEEKMQCDSSSQEKEDEQTHLNANTDGGASLLEDTKVSERNQSRTPKNFTLQTDESVFTCRQDYVYPTTVNLLRPPRSSSSDCPCIIASETVDDDDDDATVIFRHPLTSKPPFWNLPRNFDISELRPSTLAVSYHFEESRPVDKLLVVPTPPSSHLSDYINVENCTMLALYGGGELQGCPPALSRRSYAAIYGASNSNSSWVKLSSGEKFDDIIIFQDKIYAVDRQGFTKLINNYKTTRKISIGKYLTSVPITSCSGRFGWRKRLVVDGATLYVVVRTAEKSFEVFMLDWGKSRPAKVVYWKKVTGFDDNKVLFMARDYYFFQRALKKFPGRKYKNCIVFSEAAFPQYGNDCWEFTESARQLGEDNIAIFRLDDATFAREGKNPRFPKIDWSPPPWVFLAAKSQCNSSSQSERDPDEDEELDSDGQDEDEDEDEDEEEEEEVQSDSKDSASKDEEQEEMESDSDSQDEDQEGAESDTSSQDQDQEEVESDSNSQDQEEEKMQCDSNSQEKEVDEHTHLNANTAGGASLQEDTKISGKQQSQRPPSKIFALKTDKSAFTRRRTYVYSTTINLLQPPRLVSSDCPCIIAAENIAYEAGKADEADKDATVIFHHPLTSKPPFWNLPRDFDISKLHPCTLAVSYQFHVSYPVDKLLVVPTPPPCQLGELIDVRNYTLLALYCGGELQGCPRYSKNKADIAGMSTLAWVKLSSGEKFDDVISFQDKIYAIDRKGFTKLINNCKSTRKISIGKFLTSVPVTSASGRFGWRKRLVVDGATLYVVVRTAEKSFQIFRLAKGVYWNEVTRFEGNKVLFVARDYYFFRQASEKFPGSKYKNCIVFSEAAFPQYGKDCWEFTESTRKLCEDDIAVFRLYDATFAREGENPCFPKIDWSPPTWIFLAAESQCNPSTQSEREQEEMESDSDSQDQDPEVVEIVESDSGSQGHEEEKMECDTNIQDKEDEEMPLNANTDGGASLQKDVSPSLLGPKSGTTDTQIPLSATEDEITRTVLSLNGANAVIEEDTLRKNISTESVLKACTSSATKSQTSEHATSKFEGFDIRSDLVPTLQKIWQKHGNIVEKSIMRNSDIISRALESLATMVLLLEDNTAHSLSDSQADYLASTLSDLRCICFKVYWLVPYVQKAIKIHKSKSSVESLNNLSLLSSQVKKRKAVLLEELDKLGTEKNKLKEEMEKVSQLIPFCGQLKLDEPLGAGLT